MTQPTFPITFASYWGTGPDKDDTATELSYEHSPPKLTLWTGFLTLHRPKGWTR